MTADLNVNDKKWCDAMLEKTRSYFENVLSKNFSGLQDHSSIIDLENDRTIRSRLRNSNATQKNDEVSEAVDEQIMTRKTRTRRPRIPAIQSGYCAVCNLPYNNVEDHIQSKKHQKLIGGDANYIALNGSLNGFLQNNSIPFLNMNGVDAIGVHETSFEEFSPSWKKRTMPRTRARSVMCDLVKSSPLSPTGSDSAGHHLRSRRNINYMTPPSDDDSLEEHPDLTIPVEPIHPEYKEYRELRSSTRALAKLTEETIHIQEEVWNSGRPKRTCIGKKRYSLDDTPPTTNSKTFYKVEVVTPKLRPSSTMRDKGATKRQQSRSPKRDEEKEKALIVKFKKLRNSELTQLNNEATNFLFPKKDDDESSEEDDEADDEEVTTIASSVENGGTISVSCSDNEDSISTSQKFKVEDEHSMDSTCSSGKNKKKRRTHAEAFIMDNQKYYKFETPGSRLRYHGSYLPPPVIKSPKHNGDCSLKREVLKKEPEEKKMKTSRNSKVKLDNYKFSFEKVPLNAPWYSTFQRLDKGEQRYKVFSDYFWDPFILPYQMPSIPALDPRNCIHHYNQILKCLREPLSGTNSRCSTPEHSLISSPPSTYEPDMDEDSKMSVTTVSSLCSNEEGKSTDMKTRSRGLVGATVQRSPGKRPRKSPRQHASTLAILSSLIHHRRKRTKENSAEDPSPSLPAIPEEETPIDLPKEEPENLPEPVPSPLKPKEPVSLSSKPEEPVSVPLNPEESVSHSLKPKEPVLVKTKTPRKYKPKIDYFSIARQIEEELDTALDDDMENYDLDIVGENTIDFHNSKTTLADIMALYDEGKSKETENSCRRFFNGTPGRKPGRRKKMNKTGWPNKNKRQSKRGQSKEKEASNNNEDNDNDASTIDSESVNNDTDEEMCEEEPQLTDSIIKSDSEELEEVKSENNCDVDRVDQKDKILSNTLNNSRLQFQPYVSVQKLDSKNIVKKIDSPKRTNRRQRHMPGSPKSPRMLRKPRGRWYRER